MIVYFVILSTVLLGALVADSAASAIGRTSGPLFDRDILVNPRRAHTVWDWLPVLLLVGFLGSRVGVGTDYPLYATLYGRTEPEYWAYTLRESPQEIGYTVLQLLAKSVELEFQSFLWLMAFLTVVPVALALRREALPLTVGLAGYVMAGHYLASFNIMRQGAAMSLILLAVTLLPRRTWFLVLSVLAGLLHSSAIPVAALLYLAKSVRPTPKLLVAAVGGGLVLAVVYASSSIVLNVALALNPRYGDYLDGDGSGIGTYLVAAAHLLLVSMLVLRREHLNARTARYTTYAILGLPFILLGTQSVVLGRLELYFAIFLIPAYAAIWSQLRPVVRWGLTLGMLAYFVAYASSFGDLLPYVSSLTTRS
ncbi:EpsG family protein [Nocardioides campestrisoli]|uniref:EpsG family protein n=1 Tax=Nocardioides campestrisoli TaxID=2736757 RepID=UPI0015E7C61E|nr:EpsG family protein [Nocardioides campestrisoli]